MLSDFLNKIVWWLVVILAIPSILILVSWNAVPGDSTYKIKIVLEQILLGVTPTANAKSTLQIKYTQKRIDEVQKVITTSHANESLSNLTDQVVASENSVKDIKNVEEKKIQTQNLIDTLENVSQKIEQTKQSTSIENSSTSTPTPIPTKIPTIISTPTLVTNLSPSPTFIPTSTPTQIPTKTIIITPTQSSNIYSDQNISEKLDKTNEKIKETIEKLKKSQESNQNLDNPRYNSKIDESKDKKDVKPNNQ